MTDPFAPLNTEDIAATPNSKKKNDEKGTAIMPVPNDAPPPNHHVKMHNMHTYWAYLDANSNVLFYVVRFINKDGGKSDIPLTYRSFPDGRKEWKFAGAPQPRPLYGLDRLAARSDAPVIICEGEKATDAATAIFSDHVAITSPGGSRSPAYADWTPLAGRHVTIWPDNDDAGQGYAQSVAKLAKKAGARSVSIVTIPDSFEEKWDVADKLPEGMTHDDLLRLMDEAQPVIDLLENFIEKALNDPGYPFEEMTLKALAELKQESAADWQRLRARIKSQCKSVSITDLEKAMKTLGGEFEDDGKKSQVEILLEIAETASFYHSADNTAYADIDIDGRRETWFLRSDGFRRWLLKSYYDVAYSAPNNESLNAAINTLEAHAHYNGGEKEVFIRTAIYEDRHYIDLCNADWQCVEIDSNGWRVINNPPVRFRRTAGMLPLPIPSTNGEISKLQEFLNFKSRYDFILLVSWLLMAMKPKGPYPLLVFNGEQGSAKSTATLLAKRIIDPNSASLRALPRENRDFFIAANNAHVLAFDNLSKLSAENSDTLCRLSTGGGFAIRKLYADSDEIIFNATRPIVLNGIDDFISRPDLADRSLIVTLEPIPDENRLSENGLMDAFEESLPMILGALFNAFVEAIKGLHCVELQNLPRMVDFARWGTSCSKYLWGDDKAFMTAFEHNRALAVTNVIEANPIACALREFMKYRQTYEGTATELLAILNHAEANLMLRDKHWPQNARALSSAMRRTATFLRKAGIDIQMDHRDNDPDRTRKIKIFRRP